MTESSPIQQNSTSPTEHPTWCTAHTGFDDGSDDWHQSVRWEIAGHWFYVSDGTITGLPEFFMDNGEPIPLDEAKELATRMLLLIEEARA